MIDGDDGKAWLPRLVAGEIAAEVAEIARRKLLDHVSSSARSQKIVAYFVPKPWASMSGLRPRQRVRAFAPGAPLVRASPWFPDPSAVLWHNYLLSKGLT